MYVLTPQMMSKCDQDTIKAGYPEILLMEAAAYGAAELSDKLSKDKFSFKAKKDIKITVLVGKGNNGGDGLAAARILKNWGYQPEIILSLNKDDLSGVNKKNFELIFLNEINYYQFDDLKNNQFLTIIKNSDLIVDALLGTGITGLLRGNIKKMIKQINSLEKKALTIAVDIPSGVAGESGKIAGEALKADYTACMAAYKRGLLLYPGRDYTGKVSVFKIGIKAETIEKNSDSLKVFNNIEAKKLLPKRKNNGHKGSFGKIALLAGSRGMSGAPLLSSKAVLRTGAGLIYLLTAAEIEKETTAQLEELVGIPLDSTKGIINRKAAAKIVDFLKRVDLLALGPGLGSNQEIKYIVKEILKKAQLPLVLDADALNSIDDLRLLKNYKKEIIITPHPGEMARLIALSVEKINANRIKVAREFAAEHKVVVILKGAATITAAPDGRAYINTSGCNGMATAGSGDVLTGIVSALRVQGLESFKAAALAVYIHGKAGEFAAADKGDYALIASDIIEKLPQVWQNLK